MLIAARSDADAFGLFYDRHYSGLLGFFAGRVQSPESAADLCAETFAAALEGLKRFDPDRGGALQWFYGIAYHKLNRYWRDNRVSREAQQRLKMTDVAVDAATMAEIARVEADADKGALHAALGRLPEGLAVAVRLRIVDQLEYAEIATRLGCRAGAARVRVHRGLNSLKSEFEEGIDG